MSRRRAHSRSGGKESGITTQWFPGIPSLAFNRHELQNALNTFFKSGLDLLVMDNVLVRKP